MKKFTTLIICFLAVITFSNAQVNEPKSFQKEFRIAVGVNAVQNLGTRKPFTDISDWTFSLPISAALEYKFARNWAIEQAFSVNKFDTNSTLEGVVLTEDYTYLATNTNLKWYPNIFKSDKFKVFANGGVGVFKIDDLNTSANIGGGLLYWFSDSFGVRASSLAKFAFDTDDDRTFDSNHFQYMLEVIFKL